jgi:hypothetical protein
MYTIDDLEKWIWKMEWCRKNGWNPADKIFWDMAESQYQNHKEKE